MRLVCWHITECISFIIFSWRRNKGNYHRWSKNGKKVQLGNLPIDVIEANNYSLHSSMLSLEIGKSREDVCTVFILRFEHYNYFFNSFVMLNPMCILRRFFISDFLLGQLWWYWLVHWKVYRHYRPLPISWILSRSCKPFNKVTVCDYINSAYFTAKDLSIQSYFLNSNRGLAGMMMMMSFEMLNDRWVLKC